MWSVGSGAADALYALPYVLNGSRAVLLVNKAVAPLDVTLDGVRGGVATLVEAAGAEPAFQPPLSRSVSADGHLRLGAFAVAIVQNMTWQ